MCSKADKYNLKKKNIRTFFSTLFHLTEHQYSLLFVLGATLIFWSITRLILCCQKFFPLSENELPQHTALETDYYHSPMHRVQIFEKANTQMNLKDETFPQTSLKQRLPSQMRESPSLASESCPTIPTFSSVSFLPFRIITAIPNFS